MMSVNSQENQEDFSSYHLGCVESRPALIGHNLARVGGERVSSDYSEVRADSCR